MMLERALTQKSLAEKSGVPASSIASWLGKQSSLPNIEAACKIAKALECSVEDLVDLDSEYSEKVSYSKEEAQFIALYRRLNARQKFAALNFVKGMLAG